MEQGAAKVLRQDDRLSLHHLTALDADPVELVRIAGALDVPYVCLFTCSRSAAFPIVDAANESDVLAALHETGVRVYNAEYVALTPDMSLDGIPDALARTRRLGARRMTVHVHDPVEERACANFVTVCEMAAREGLSIGVEWTAVNHVTSTLADVRRFLDRAGQPNAQLCVDLMHLTRSGGTVAEIAALPRDAIGYAQISDGPLGLSLEEYGARELIYERAPPGEGEFATTAFIAALPPEVVIDVEAPQAKARDAGVSAFDRCRTAVLAARRFVIP